MRFKKAIVAVLLVTMASFFVVGCGDLEELEQEAIEEEQMMEEEPMDEDF